MKSPLALSLLILVSLGLAGCPEDTTPQKVFLWGDSIRVGYEAPLIELSPVAWTYYSPIWYNGMTAASLRAKLNDLPLENYTLFHLNTGLHDVFAVPSPTASEYATSWRSIVAYIRSRNPGAPIVLATTTAMDGRNAENALTASYNFALYEIADEFPRVSINDLRALQEVNSNVVHPAGDVIHFTATSYEIMAQQVLLALQQAETSLE
jgi:hypothetical protein